MLKSLLEDAGLAPEACASLLGISPRIFNSWVNGVRDLPGDVIPELASCLGVSQTDLTGGRVNHAPAIWFKFRGSNKLSSADRELILLIRRLGYYANQLDVVTSSSTARWQILFNVIMTAIQRERQASPAIQGSVAAKAFRGVFDLGFPRKQTQITGNGDLIRPMLRNYGILIIEMPVPRSSIDGCSFYVGEPGEERPCLFVNTYQQSWFRRNSVLVHELAHAIFDIGSEAASIDFRVDDGAIDFKEVRAEAFGSEALVPREMLRHLQNMLGLKWESLSSYDLASVVAYSQIELKTILKAAQEHGFIDALLAKNYQDAQIHDELKGLTERALTTLEFMDAPSNQIPAALSVSSRMTTIPSRPLRLPVPYITKVLTAVNDGLISESKAAEMLMIDEERLAERFGKLIQPIAVA
jgi:Zn-dependent peptidase ImmA (M78 family)/DNA-binding transcriptional regulator YdaS (Cro superfamily)